MATNFFSANQPGSQRYHNQVNNNFLPIGFCQYLSIYIVVLLHFIFAFLNYVKFRKHFPLH